MNAASRMARIVGRALVLDGVVGRVGRLAAPVPGLGRDGGVGRNGGLGRSVAGSAAARLGAAVRAT
ncbi:hypothetical protein GA0070608_4454 [Micromonospora peucetia]|uniref:Uncharacterized protein n=1 Tax=Micromonospora peucetia TaxID=47871 RepID=A0A1C6VXH1_9ACTN|nr:hypothetical protein GA0070608_4454 [Micromonospora peucetia]